MNALEKIDVFKKTGMLLTEMDTSFLEIKRTSTVFKRLKRKMDTVYLYLFGFNFRCMVGDRDLGFYWVPGILQDTGRIIRTIKYKFKLLVLNFIIFYCKIRGKESNMKKWEKTCMESYLDKIEYKNN